MDDKVRTAFANSSVALSKLYKEVITISDEAEKSGRIEALQEMLVWARDLQIQGLKYIPVSDLIRKGSEYNMSVSIEDFPESRKRAQDDWQ